MQKATEAHKDDIERFIALQFLFDRQWKAVKVRLVMLQKLLGCPLLGSLWKTGCAFWNWQPHT